MKERVKEYFYITLSVFSVALGLSLCLIPNKVVQGGVSGISTILHYLIDVPVGVTMLFFNIVLFILAFKIMGIGFGIKSIYATFMLSVFVDLLYYLLPKDWIITNLNTAVIFGSFLTGAGLGTVLSRNASTGGTDIIAAIVNKLTGFPTGWALLVTDFIITLFAGISFGKDIGIYSLIAVIINSFVIDQVLMGVTSSFEVMIVTKKGRKIADRILKEIGRGVTIFEGVGAFTNRKREVLWVIVKTRKEFISLKKMVKEEDKGAFISVKLAKEVLGEGFKNI
jgi:uncharacterized membrane-anchored protein YitT (DUF2179 family)